MVEKKVIKPLKPKMSKVVFVPKDIIISPAKHKTRQTDVKGTYKPDYKRRKHKRTIRKK